MQRHELLDTLQSPDFGDRLVQTSTYTARENLEAAFAVYDGPGISQAVYQTQTDMRKVEKGHDFASLSRESIGQLDVRHLEKLTHTSDNPELRPTPRTDLTMFIHTHPVFNHNRPKDSLHPSTGDLAGFEKRVLQNREHIDGIAIRHQELGGIALLLYRATSGFNPQRLQMIEDTSNTPLAIRRMREAGVQSAVLTFDTRKGHLVSDPNVINSLY